MEPQLAETLLEDPKWGWRHADFEGASKAEQDAASFLRKQADQARSWLMGVSEAAGLPLPLGNGTNGPWHLLAVSDGTRFGVLDIAKGVLNITDAVLPDSVRMFVMVDSATSHHFAGGSGTLPNGWGQIPLVLFNTTKKAECTSRIIERTWGFRTCYGWTGTAPNPLDGVFDTETDLPQWEDIESPREVDPKAWAHLMGTSDDTRLKPGYMSIGKIKLHSIAVFGTPSHRKARSAELSERWSVVAAEEANKPLAGATQESDLSALLQEVVLNRKVMGLPPLPRLPSGRSGYHDRFDNTHALRHALIFLGFEGVAPEDPRTDEHLFEVNRIVEAMLGIPPTDMAQRVGKSNSANRASYLIKHVFPHEKRDHTYDLDVEDDPRVGPYLSAVSNEIRS